MFRITCGNCGEKATITERDHLLITFFGEKVEIQADGHKHIKLECNHCHHKIIFKCNYI